MIKSLTTTGSSVLVTLAIATAGLLTWIIYKKHYAIKSRSTTYRKFLTDPKVKHSLRLIERKDLSHNARHFRFELPKNTCLGIEPGQHIYLSATINDSLVVRTYSPVSTNSDIGFMDLIIKVYLKNINPKFPNGGKMSQFLNDLEIGQSVNIRGPAGRMVYRAATSEFVIQGEKKSDQSRIIEARKINIVAGGSGLTPMLQILKAVFDEQNFSNLKATTVRFIYANQTEDDILCKEYVDNLAKVFPDKFRIWYTLTQPPPEWHGGCGRVSRPIFHEHLFPPSTDGIQLLCGPNPMISTCISILNELQFNPDRTFVY